MSKIRVGMNGRVLAKPHPGGVGRYTRCLLSEFDSGGREGDCSVVAIGAESVDGLPDGIRTTARVSAHSGIRAHAWEQLTLPRIVRRQDIDLLHTPAGQPPVLASVPLVTTIHDVSPITNPEWFSDSYVALYRLLTPLAIRASDRIITVSEFARREILQAYPSAEGKTVVVYNGVTPRESSGSRPDEQPDDDYLLFVGSMNPRKNLDGLLRGYRTYRRRVADPLRLVLVGPKGDVFAAPDVPTVEGVHRLGFVSDSELTWLYENALAFLFPSLYEGFGLPILEAMSAGTSVVTSNRGAMAEVAGDAACLVNPTCPDAIADGIEKVHEDREYRHHLQQKGHERSTEFTWERTARNTVEVYKEVIADAT